MAEKGFVNLRPLYPITNKPDPDMDGLLRLYAKNGECPDVLGPDTSAENMSGYLYEQEEDPRPYPWPASRITSEEMAILVYWRMRTGTPINELLRQCVQEMDKLIRERST